ncbi:hypothetical protein MUU53_20670 [Rhizobium lemnae]|uniref:Uncharacterized protein n=1 Tax=Rhizobium lemnae TaxID=1214924 RepID=A0ABV8EEV2_9HYPH|nr:hypothetical protein [Rhizobium lemnae]MCJ8510304.1 hypothetical protein [Rhizobium lemnae]
MRIYAAIAATTLFSSASVAGANEHALDGRYAFYQAATAAEMDRGPRNDADCRKFIASALFESRNRSEDLQISGNRWQDNQDVTLVTGNVILKTSKGGVIPFTIDIESEGDSGPAKGTVKRVGQLGLSVAISGQVLHYCKMGD